MCELRNTKIIAVDHALRQHGNSKYRHTNRNQSSMKQKPIFTGNILEYNGIYYRIKRRHKEFIPDKAMDEDIIF